MSPASLTLLPSMGQRALVRTQTCSPASQAVQTASGPVRGSRRLALGGQDMALSSPHPWGTQLKPRSGGGRPCPHAAPVGRPGQAAPAPREVSIPQEFGGTPEPSDTWAKLTTVAAEGAWHVCPQADRGLGPSPGMAVPGNHCWGHGLLSLRKRGTLPPHSCTL